MFLGPALYAFYLSFTRYRGFGTARWVGLDNYGVVLESEVFWITLSNTGFYWLAHAPPMMALAMLLAVLVRSRLVRWQGTFKAIVFLPQMLASVATALLFQNIFGTHYGVLNGLFGTQIPWLTDPDMARWSVVSVLIWRGTGYWFLVFLAGLTTIDPEIEEAARIDGVNAWQLFTRITLPLMRPTILFAVVVDAIVTLRLFAEPNVLTGRAGGLASTDVAPVLNVVVENMRAGQFGLASAAGWLLFVLISGVTFMMFRLMRQRNV
jgi:ABC-type sugar transport system permease subunit